jgi:cyclophilin family peptidyl-prolyl cis-trans isomerase
VLAQIQKDYPQDVRIAYRHFPLVDIHDKAMLAAQAANAAGEQDKFWEMHDLLFERQAEWADMTPADFETWLSELAAELELDVTEFTSALTAAENVAQVQESYDYYASIGLPGTPFLTFNGLPIQVSLSYDSVASAVEAYLLEKRQYKECPEMVIDPEKQYTATIQTEQGDIVVELYASQAPLAVNSFVFLAQEGWFDSVTFHRVLPGFVAQGGDPSGSGMGGPGYQFDNETPPELTFNAEGLLAMANAGPDTNGSQFFITFAPTPELNGGYTIFGKVIAGMEIAKSLTPRDPSQGGELPPGDRILGITITEK